MMPVAGSPPGKCACIRVLAVGIEHLRRLAVSGHPFPAKVAEMGAQGAHPGSVTDDPRFDDGPAGPLVEKSPAGSPRRDSTSADGMLGRSCRAASGDT